MSLTSRSRHHTVDLQPCHWHCSQPANRLPWKCHIVPIRSWKDSAIQYPFAIQWDRLEVWYRLDNVRSAYIVLSRFLRQPRDAEQNDWRAAAVKARPLLLIMCLSSANAALCHDTRSPVDMNLRDDYLAVAPATELYGLKEVIINTSFVPVPYDNTSWQLIQHRDSIWAIFRKALHALVINRYQIFKSIRYWHY